MSQTMQDESNDKSHKDPSFENLEIEAPKPQTEESSPRCCGRLRADARLPFFGVKEANGKVMDVQGSFAPRPKLQTVVAKVLLFGWSIQVMAQGIAEIDTQSFYLAFLTHWSLVMANMYMFCSLVISLLKEPEQPDENGRPGFLVRFTWATFSIAAVAEITATLLFWILDFDPDNGVDYLTIMPHGGVMVLVLLEGFGVNRIPVRAKHIVFPEMFSLAYVIWSIIHAASDIGNPLRNDGEEDPDGDDDAIYSSLNWNERPRSAAVVSVVCIFIVIPLLFVLVWYMSLMSCLCKFDGSNRRYYQNVTTDNEGKELVEQSPV